MNEEFSTICITDIDLFCDVEIEVSIIRKLQVA